MTHAEILEELKRLTLTERLAVVETALQLIRADLQHNTWSSQRIGTSRKGSWPQLLRRYEPTMRPVVS